MDSTTPQDRFLREPEVRDTTRLSPSTRWRLEREGTFPKQRQLSPGAVGGLESEIQAWVAHRQAVQTGAS